MNRVKIGIVGLNFGKYIIEQLLTGTAKDYFELAAVCDIDTNKAMETAEKFAVKAYFDLDELLLNPDIPAIGLFTSPVGRAELIRKIIYSGKDVMTTKPFEVDPDKALEVLKEADRMGKAVHLNSPSPLLPPDLVQIRKWVKEYDLGRPIACRCDSWTSYRENMDGSWYDDPNKCPVAPIFRLGIYLINDLVRLFGKAEKVQVMQSRIFTNRPTSDNAQLGIQFENGLIANIYGSFCINDGQYYRNSMILNYENGTIYRDIGLIKLGEANGLKMSVIKHDLMDTHTIKHGRSGDYQWDVFYRTINGERPDSMITPEEVVEGVKIIKAMNKAQKSGCMEFV